MLANTHKETSMVDEIFCGFAFEIIDLTVCVCGICIGLAVKTGHCLIVV
jgi:hypothetical protein